MNNKVLFPFVGLLIIILAACQQNKEYSKNRPNFLLITADNLGYSDLGVYGSEIATPNLDELAQKGMQFTNFYATDKDVQTRAMLLTGIAKSQAENAPHLKKEVKNIAQLVQESGYRTLISGKWNLGKELLYLPVTNGFEQSFVISEEASGHLGNKRFLPALYKEGGNIQEVSEDFYSTQYFSRKIQSFLSKGKKKERRKPFFAYLSYTAPNAPLQASFYTIEDQKGKYDEGYKSVYEQRLAKQKNLGINVKETATINLPDWQALTSEEQAYEARKMEIYAAMIQDLDKEIGKLIDFLKVSKQYKNTIIIFLSDNGVLEQNINKSLARVDNSLENIGQANSLVTLGEGWITMKRGALTEKIDNSAVETSIKAPLIIHSALFENKENRRIEKFKTILDIAPTILDFAEISHPSENYFDGTLPMDGASLRLMLLNQE